MRSVFASLALVALLPIAAQATPETADERIRFFATCAGRLSAQIEHHWLLSEPADRSEHRRAATLGLLAAVTPPDRQKEALSRRIEAKASFAALLSRATFGTDAEDASWAARQADRLLSPCTDILLG